MSKVVITFQPDALSAAVDRGETLLQAAVAAGVHIDAACGGAGTCGRCKVKLLKGMTTCVAVDAAGPTPAIDGHQLACRCAAQTDVTVEVVGQARLDRAVLGAERRARVRSVPEAEPAAGAELGPPPVQKHRVSLSPPRPDENGSDQTRLLHGLYEQHGLGQVRIENSVYPRLAAALRDGGWTATATTALVGTETFGQGPRGAPGERRKLAHELIRVEPGDTTERPLVAAIDVGTTTVWGQLIDLSTRRVLATSSDYNAQISHGEDVITRMVAAERPGGLEALQAAVVGTMNGVLREVLRAAGASGSALAAIFAAGNTTMTHLLLGLPPRSIREAPYVLTTNYFPAVRARDLGLEAHEALWLYPLPAVSSYVGGDIVAGVLAAGIHHQRETTLFLDLGTNGELVVGNSEWMVCTSCSAGPALEGGGVRCGVRAIPGAVEEFHLHPVTLEPMVATMGGAPAIGLAGVGLIATLAELRLRGILEPNGKFNTEAKSERLRVGPDGPEFVVVEARHSGTGADLVLTEPDIQNIIRAKAALYAGVQTLLDAVNLRLQDVDRVVIAGALGNWLDLDQSVFIGLLPDVPREKFAYLGNGSLRGARLCALSAKHLAESERIAAMMTNIELSDNHRFVENYLAAMFLPHTDLERFPSAEARLRAGGRL